MLLISNSVAMILPRRPVLVFDLPFWQYFTVMSVNTFKYFASRPLEYFLEPTLWIKSVRFLNAKFHSS